jgi:hypothetical protein
LIPRNSCQIPLSENQSQLLLCHFCRGSLQPDTLKIVKLFKVLKKFACVEQRVVARWQEIVWWRDYERLDHDLPFLSRYRSRPVGRFSNPNPILTVRTNLHGWLWKSTFG